MLNSKKFQPVYGKFLRVALEAVFDEGVDLEEIIIQDLRPSPEEIELLTHEGFDSLKVYSKAELEGDLLSSDDARITFSSWVSTDVEDRGVKTYWLVFRSKPLGPNLPIFARFGEIDTFGAKPHEQFKPRLLYFGMTKNEAGELEVIPFNPLYVKFKERYEDVYIVIKSDKLGELQLSIVSEDEAPEHLRVA